MNIRLALLCFNIGVEAGQIMFVATVLALVGALQRTHERVSRGIAFVASYGIGVIVAFWLLQRAAAF